MLIPYFKPGHYETCPPLQWLGWRVPWRLCLIQISNVPLEKAQWRLCPFTFLKHKGRKWFIIQARMWHARKNPSRSLPLHPHEEITKMLRFYTTQGVNCCIYKATYRVMQIREISHQGKCKKNGPKQFIALKKWESGYLLCLVSLK